MSRVVLADVDGVLEAGALRIGSPGLEAGSLSIPAGGEIDPRAAVNRSRGLARVVHMAGEAVSSHILFLDVGGDTSETMLILSSMRSGSTWLAGMLNSRNDRRLMMEPFRADRVRAARRFLWGQYLEPSDEAPRLMRPSRRILTGRARGLYVDFLNERRLSRRRLIKDVSATNLAPWFRRWFPSVRIVYLLRNPVAATGSAVDLRFPDFLDDFLVQTEMFSGPLHEHANLARRIASSSGAVERHALRWCLENVIPLQMLRPDDMHVVFYEHLVTRPEQELRRLTAGLGLRFDASAVTTATRPSATDLRGRAAALDRRHLVSESVDSIPLSTRDAIRRIVDSFGLGHLYGSEPLPLVEPEHVLT